jgi:hypothetical protein
MEILDGVPDGYRVSIHQDGDAASPRDMADDPVHVLTVPHRDYADVDRDPGPWDHQWRHLLGRYDWSKAITVIERYAVLVGGFTYDHAPNDGARSVWYLTREDAADWADPRPALIAHAREYQAWTEGDVYGYVIERRVVWQRADDPTVTEDRWEDVESCWGFYGPDHEYVEQEARAALAALL